EAWLEYVKETFMFGEEGGNRPDVDAEFKRLDESGELPLLRERDRLTTYMYLAEIFKVSPEGRNELYALTGAQTLALVQDRIHLVTQLLIGLVQKEVQIKV